MLNHCNIRENPSCSGDTHAYDGINLIYAGGHCHAPSCISVELYNADSGELLCHHTPIYGKSNQVFVKSAFTYSLVYVNQLRNNRPKIHKSILEFLFLKADPVDMRYLVPLN